MRRMLLAVADEMLEEMLGWPLSFKIYVGIGISLLFIVITQWERLGGDVMWAKLRGHPVAVVSSSSSPPPPQAQRSFSFSTGAAPSEDDVVAVEASLLKRIGRLTIANPTIQPDGSIAGGTQLVRLYGIKPFNSKNVCTRRSKEKWACGLRAYATLRNETAQQTITCEPTKILADGIAATCRIKGTNITVPLLRDGLVEIDGSVPVDSEMTDAQQLAKNQKLGIWDR